MLPPHKPNASPAFLPTQRCSVSKLLFRSPFKLFQGSRGTTHKPMKSRFLAGSEWQKEGKSFIEREPITHHTQHNSRWLTFELCFLCYRNLFDGDLLSSSRTGSYFYLRCKSKQNIKAKKCSHRTSPTPPPLFCRPNAALPPNYYFVLPLSLLG